MFLSSVQLKIMVSKSRIYSLLHKEAGNMHTVIDISPSPPKLSIEYIHMLTIDCFIVKYEMQQ